MGAWAFLLIGVAIGAGIATVWFDGVETRLRAEIDALRGYLSLMGNVTVLRPVEPKVADLAGARLRKELQEISRKLGDRPYQPRRPW